VSSEEDPISGARGEASETEGTPDAPREAEGETRDDAIDASASGTPPVPDDAGSPDAASESGDPVPAEETPVPAESATESPVEEQIPAEPSVQEPVPSAQPAPDAEQAPPEAPREDLPETPRARPEIPGADLIPDIMPPEQEEFLDAEARAAAEAEAEARAAREREQEEELQSEPIADAAIDLAAGARYSATGKRKRAVARVILRPGSGNYSINGKPLELYFPRDTLQRLIRQPLETVGYDSRMDVVARMHGGGTSAQAGALRHGISRALIVADPHLRGELKRRGYLTRDPRVKERKKAGLKKARKRPQFSKR
jgi:small subunit ribosomal protein S9